LSNCTRPIDPLDLQALAAGEEPLLGGAGARDHALHCAACARQLQQARALSEILGLAPDLDPPMPDLADRILRAPGLFRRLAPGDPHQVRVDEDRERYMWTRMREHLAATGTGAAGYRRFSWRCT